MVARYKITYRCDQMFKQATEGKVEMTPFTLPTKIKKNIRNKFNKKYEKPTWEKF